MTYKKTIIAGLGNSLAGDDGIGLVVLEALSVEELPRNVILKPVGDDSLSLLYDLDGVESVILVDAADWGSSPGRHFIAEAEAIHEKNTERKFSLHQPSVHNLISLAKVLGKKAKFTLIGIQPERIALGEGLSDPVRKAIPLIVSDVKEIVAGLCPA